MNEDIEETASSSHREASIALDAAGGTPPDSSPPATSGEKASVKAANRVNALEHWAEEAAANEPLEIVRLNASDMIVVPFTAEAVQARLHYCEDPEVRGYVHCNGPKCVLCLAGRAVDERVLFPVYLPATRSVAVLPVSPASRPGSLRPQILPALRSPTRVALVIRKPDQARFDVRKIDLKPGMDDGAAVIKAFLKRYESGEVDLESIYVRMPDRELASISGVAAILAFKGLAPDDLD